MSMAYYISINDLIGPPTYWIFTVIYQWGINTSLIEWAEMVHISRCVTLVTDQSVNPNAVIG